MKDKYLHTQLHIVNLEYSKSRLKNLHKLNIYIYIFKIIPYFNFNNHKYTQIKRKKEITFKRKQMKRRRADTHLFVKTFS